MLAEHGISGQPQSQAFCENLRLLNPGLGHQNDEFVSTVSGDHVHWRHSVQAAAPPAQYQVAFHVSEGVINFLELVQIDEHDRKGRPGRRRVSTPGKRFPEKPSGLDTGQPVSD